MTRILITLTFFMLVATNAWCQSNAIIVGKVLSNTDRSPLENVEIREKEMPNVVQTDVNGEFRINATNLRARLIFSRVGYEIKEVSLYSHIGYENREMKNGETRLIVLLKPDEKNISTKE